MNEDQIIDHQRVIQPLHNNHIALCSLILGPLAGARMTHINSYIHLGKKKANIIYFIELLLIVVLMKIIPDRSNNWIAGIFLTHIILTLIVVIADRLINVNSIKEYVAQGIPYHTLKFIVPRIALYFLLYILLLGAFNLRSIYTNVAISQYEKYNGIIYYEKDIDLKTIDKIAEAMHTFGYFNSTYKSVLSVYYRQNRYMVIYTFFRKDILDPTMKSYYEELTTTIKETLKPNKVNVLFLDENEEKMLEF
jgi:hypothetical protein